VSAPDVVEREGHPALSLIVIDNCLTVWLGKPAPHLYFNRFKYFNVTYGTA